MAEERRMDSHVALDINLMILDYLIYSAIKGLLDANQARGTQTELSPLAGSVPTLIKLVDNFFHIFRASHPDFDLADTEINRSAGLLTFLVLLTQRYQRSELTPSSTTLKDARNQDAARAKDWLASRRLQAHENRDEKTLSQDQFTSRISYGAKIHPHELNQSRRRVLSEKGVTIHENFYGTEDSVSLLDVVPKFISLCACAAKDIHWALDDQLMTMFAEMLQCAATEQYLVFGAGGKGPLDTAYSWGWIDHEYEEGTDSALVNDLFRGRSADWEDMRDGSLMAFWPDQGKPFLAHVTAMATELPTSHLEAAMLVHLRRLFDSRPKPLLVQIEMGHAEGLSPAETEQLKARLGWR